MLPAQEKLAARPPFRRHEYRLLVFDLLHADGYDLRGLSLTQRRRCLRACLRFSPTLMYVRESSAPARVVFHQAERERWPGVVAKRGDSAYVGGESREWRVWRRPADGEADAGGSDAS